MTRLVGMDMTFFSLNGTVKVGHDAISANAANPSICEVSPSPQDDGYIMNIRWINSGYDTRGVGLPRPKTYVSSNSRLRLDSALMPSGRQVLLSELEGEPWSMGLQDVRLCLYEGVIHFLAAKAIGRRTEQVYGKYLLTGTSFLSPHVHIKPSFANPVGLCEKNWVFYPTPMGLRVIHSWHPLRICEISPDNTLEPVQILPTPKLFSTFRGSSSMFMFKGRCAFVVHSSERGTVRFRRLGLRRTEKLRYTHRIVTLNLEGRPWTYSESFKFGRGNIEFCTSALATDRGIVMCGSLQDKECFIGKIPENVLFSQLRWAKV